MPSWNASPAGHVYAVRGVLLAGLDAQLVSKQADIAAAGLNYSIPTEMKHILIRQSIVRPEPKDCPQVQISWRGRQINQVMSFQKVNTPTQLIIHVWVSGTESSAADSLDGEEVLSLQAMDVLDAINQTLRKVPGGVYGAAGGEIGNAEETSQVYRTAYADRKLGAWTIEGRLVVSIQAEAYH